MFKRIKRLWQLSQKDPKAIEKLEKLTDEDMDYIPEAPDGKAVFFTQGTEQEFEDLQKEDKGLKAWYERLKNL